jgi:hypothetical protein
MPEVTILKRNENLSFVVAQTHKIVNIVCLVSYLHSHIYRKQMDGCEASPWGLWLGDPKRLKPNEVGDDAKMSLSLVIST